MIQSSLVLCNCYLGICSVTSWSSSKTIITAVLKSFYQPSCFFFRDCDRGLVSGGDMPSIDCSCLCFCGGIQASGVRRLMVLCGVGIFSYLYWVCLELYCCPNLLDYGPAEWCFVFSMVAMLFICKWSCQKYSWSREGWVQGATSGLWSKLSVGLGDSCCIWRALWILQVVLRWQGWSPSRCEQSLWGLHA